MVTMGSELVLRGTGTETVAIAANAGHTNDLDEIRLQAGPLVIRRRAECGSYGQGAGEQFSHPSFSFAGLVATQQLYTKRPQYKKAQSPLQTCD
jgi:hypothetical protein